jgi:acetyl esterase/lipase
VLKYDPKLSEILKNEKTFIEKYGISIQVKSIPDENKPGVFDPRQYELSKASAEAYAKNTAQNAMSGGDPIQAMRDMMGFPNLNLNTVEIITKYETINLNGNEVGIWSYRPRRPLRKTGRPGFIYIHGGGWIGGATFTLENPCKLLAERADCVVFNIDYSLAPEKPYPNGFNDCFGALEYIYGNAEKFGVDKDKLCMGGDSAGGNLTAAVALRDRDEGKNMLKLQALIYPAVTFVHDGIEGFNWTMDDYEIDDTQRFMIEPGLSLGRPAEDGGGGINLMERLYLSGGGDPGHPYISPMLADKRGLCRALIAVAEFDGLRISGEVYGRQLKDAGVDVRVLRYRGVGHAFIDMLGVLPQAEDLIGEIACEIKSMF